MLRDNLVELIEPMLNSAGADPLALYIHTRTPASDDRLPCLKNPRPEGAESSLTESASSPFQAEPAHFRLAIPWRVALPQGPPPFYQRVCASCRQQPWRYNRNAANGKQCLNCLSHAGDNPSPWRAWTNSPGIIRKSATQRA